MSRWALFATLFACLAWSCHASQGESCEQSDDCHEGLVCYMQQCQDPKSFCRSDPATKTACEQDGLCTLVEGKCTVAGAEDCQATRRCKEFQQCTAKDGCCSVDGHCIPPADDPVTQLLRLGDGAQRAAALEKLRAQLDSRLKQDGGDRGGKNVAPLIASMIDPLVALSKQKDLEPKVRAEVLSLLADTHHSKAADALLGVLDAYLKRKGDAGPEDVVMAKVVNGLAASRAEQASDRILALFTELRASSSRAGLQGFGKAVGRAMIASSKAAWEPKLIELLEKPAAKRSETDAWRDQLYWKSHAALALGRLHSEKAIEPLLRVALSPLEDDVAPYAVAGLAQIGKPAVALTLEVLQGKNAALKAYVDKLQAQASEEETAGGPTRSADQIRVERAAIVLAHIGRADGVDAVITGLDGTDEVGKANIAKAMTKLPHGGALIDAFKKQYETLPLDVAVSPELQGLAGLIAEMPMFFDGALVSWLVDGSIALPGTDTATAPFREAAMNTAMLLARPQDMAELERLGELITPTKWTSEHAQLDQLLKECTTDLTCFANAAKAQLVRGRPTFKHLKAATMLGQLGTADSRPTVLATLKAVKHPELRAILAGALEHLSPEGDGKLADELTKAMDDAGWQDELALVGCAGRLRGRAQ